MFSPVFSSPVTRGLSCGFLPNMSFTFGQTWSTAKLFVSELVEINFLLSERFFHVFVIFVATVGLPFCLFLQTFPPISDLIDLARRFISRLMLIVLSGTKSNRGIKFIPWLGRCNPRLALIAFPGTRAGAKAISYPESWGFLVSGTTPLGTSI